MPFIWLTKNVILFEAFSSHEMPSLSSEKVLAGHVMIYMKLQALF